MYLVMYSMADRLQNVYFNLRNVHMTGLIAGSMLPVMLLTMRGMLRNKKVNIVLWAASAVALALCWFLLRGEAGVGDRQFLRAMIPHHAAAIQMCKASSITGSRVERLCAQIVSAQEREIAEMKALLSSSRLSRRQWHAPTPASLGAIRPFASISPSRNPFARIQSSLNIFPR